MPLPYGEFTLQSFGKPSLLFRATLDDGAPMPTSDSYSGWQLVEVPKRMALVEWMGKSPPGLEISFYIDRRNAAGGSQPGRYVERMFNQLERMAGMADHDDDPPLLTFNSEGMCPHDVRQNPHYRWVIESLEWDGERFAINRQRRALFIAGKLVLRLFNDDEALDAYRGPAKRNRDKHQKRKKSKRNKRSSRNRYRVKDGDTLSQIAARELGRAERWKDIAELNDIRHPRTQLRAGMLLRLP